MKRRWRATPARSSERASRSCRLPSRDGPPRAIAVIGTLAPAAARRVTHRWLVIGAAAVTAAVLVARRESRASARPPGRQSILVAPFRTDGANPSLGYLREGIVELLSTRLA